MWLYVQAAGPQSCITRGNVKPGWGGVEHVTLDNIAADAFSEAMNHTAEGLKE